MRKSSIVPSSGWIAVCPPKGEPMAQGTPGSSGVGSELVVGAFAEGGPDRMDRRQVEHVEAHVGDIGQLLGDVGKSPMPGRVL